MTLYIDRDYLEVLTRHARREFPNECCGILVGRWSDNTARVSRAVEARNIAEHDRTKAYQIDWESLFSTIRRERGGPERIIGFYHSHPDGSAEPSDRDTHFAWPDHFYLVIAIDGAGLTSVTNWRTPRASPVLQRETMAVTPQYRSARSVPRQ